MNKSGADENLTNNLADFLSTLSIYKLDEVHPTYEKILCPLSEPGIDGVSYTFEIDPGIYQFNHYFPFNNFLLNVSDLIWLKNNKDDTLILDNKIIPKIHTTGFLPIRHMNDVKVELYKENKEGKEGNNKIVLQGYALSIKNRILLNKILQKSNSNGAGICFMGGKYIGIYKSPLDKHEFEQMLEQYYPFHEFD